MTGFHAPQELAIPISGPEELISYQFSTKGFKNTNLRTKRKNFTFLKHYNNRRE